MNPGVRHNLTSIIIVTYNSRSDFEPCLNSLKTNTFIPHEIIVVDNASQDDTPTFLKQQKDIK